MSFSVPGDDHDGINLLVGRNMSGKSTVFHSILWALVGGDINSLHGTPRIGPVHEVWRRSTEAKDVRWSSSLSFLLGDEEFTSGVLGGIRPAPPGRDPVAYLTDNSLKEVAAYYLDAAHYSKVDGARPLLLYYPARAHLYARLPTVPIASEVGDDWTSFNPFINALTESKFDETLALYGRYRYMVRGDDVVATREPRLFDDTRLMAALEPFLEASARIGATRIAPRGAWEAPPVFDIYGTPVHGPALSDGFVSAFGLAVDLFLRLSSLPDGIESKATAIIDELSVFLHPEWQLSYLPMLRGLFPKTQFIVATHSPFVVASTPEAKFFTIHRSENTSWITDDTETARRWTLQQVVRPFGVSLRAPLFDALESEFNALAEKQRAGATTPDELERMSTLTRTLAAADPAFAVLAELEHLPDNLDELLASLRQRS